MENEFKVLVADEQWLIPQAPLSLSSLGEYNRQGLPDAVKRDTPPRVCVSKACLEASEFW